PAEKILQVAKDEDVDIIGLSGLITPSLDEMVHVASEMQRLDFKIPLLIGGATTSKAHTAVKIEENYQNDSTVYVPDASRSVTVVSDLLNADKKAGFCSSLREEYETIRVRSANRSSKRELVEYNAANGNALNADFVKQKPATPTFTGTRVFEDYDLNILRDYIDWTPFFITWSLVGKYPAILQDDKVGEAARELFDDAQQMLDKIIAENLVQAKAVIGFWPAQRNGANDVALFNKNGSNHPLATLHFLRQQMSKDESLSHLCLADYVADDSASVQDYVGGFVVTAGLGVDELVSHYEKENNDYNALLVKALADRLAEAFAEHMHQRVRKEFWAYQPDEALSNDELISEKYQGIRPAPGYPACPDHSEKETLFNLLDAHQAIGVNLTESFAMTPAASVSGLYFSHPEAKYFSVGKITQEQVQDLAQRKGVDSEELSRLLAPNLS
ncbi:MAG: methionine synthase, partial [Pseudomonadales bacterium]|nr:methionine synthase [Pseudomonadales bacterium]